MNAEDRYCNSIMSFAKPSVNIPIYRARKQDSNEYVVGYYSSAYDIHHYIITHLGVDTKANAVYQMSTDIHKIDPTTLAIHFPDMLDKQKNKIFASLSKNGKGGDLIESEFKYKGTVKYKEYFFYADNEENHINCFGFKNSKVIGIQE